ncbi:MAG: DUF6769 family protein [Candidatus Limimorpha sp.]
MMSKIKNIGVFMLIVSWVILLFHSVTPHHNHQDVIVCFENHHHDCDSHHDCYDNCGGGHNSCVISDFFSPSDTQHLSLLFSFIDNIVSQLHYYLDDSCFKLILGLEGTQFREPPYLLNINETDVVHLGVLRAPPTC